MSTPSAPLDDALASLPAAFRSRIPTVYLEMRSAYRRGEYDLCGLKAGKFCEVLLRYLQHDLTATYTPFGTRLPDVAQLCRDLEKAPKNAGPESFRVLIPRAVSFIYTVRNKRDIGHVGGDLDANRIDAATLIRTVDWCLGELIRVRHSLPLEDAQDLLDSLADREMPMVWSGAGVKRVLDPSKSRAEQVLLLLYSAAGAAVPVEDLAAWIEVPRLSDFIARTVLPLHASRAVEYDRGTRTVLLLPPGSDRARALLGEGG
jgi:hypothetical protein